MLPNPSLALQASMAREVSFPNGASSAGGPTNLKIRSALPVHKTLAFSCFFGFPP